MHSRSRRLLTGATLTMLAVACAAGLGASKATAASQIVHKITACGYTATQAGTYELTQSVTDSGSGPCITVNGSNITLYLDSHTITGTATDTCILVQGGGPGMIVKDTIVGGKMITPGMKKKAKKKASKPATLTNCQAGLVVVNTSTTMVSNLIIVAPTSVGVVAEVTAGATFSHINVPLHAANSSPGFILEGGADNVVMNSTVNYDGTSDAFLVEEETGDTFMRDTVNDPYHSTGSTGTGFFDAQSSRNTYSHCTSSGQQNGFSLSPVGYGPVTATYNTATGSSANSGSFGFSITGAFQSADTGATLHTLISHNKSTGFETGFQDQSGPGPGAVAETWTNNTANNYSAIGFLINFPTDYTMTGNIADANTSGKTYGGGTSYGFAFVDASPHNPFAHFSNNQAYDSEYGFYSDALVVGGKGNIAKRNKYNTHYVEITG